LFVKSFLESIVGFLRGVEHMLSFGVLAVKSCHDGFQFLLHQSVFLLSDLRLPLVQLEDLLLFCVDAVDLGQVLLKVVLVDLELAEVDVDDPHGVLTSRGIVHDVVPVL